MTVASLSRLRRDLTRHNQAAIKSFLLLFLLVLFLLGSRLPSEYAKVAAVQSSWRPEGTVPISFSDRWEVAADASAGVAIALTALNFWRANLIGMTFGLALGGAALSLLLTAPAVSRSLGRRGFGGVLLGAALGAPLNLCANCAAVTSEGACSRVRAPEAAYGIVLGSALWNIVGLTTIAALFPPSVIVARIVFSVALTFVALPLLSRALARGQPVVPSGGDMAVPTMSWRDAGLAALYDWWQSCVTLASRLLPLMLVATLLAAIARVLIQPLFGPLGGDTPGSITALALAGTIVSIPVLFEIPLAIIVTQLGAGVGGVAALICTAPSIGIFTVIMMARTAGWRLAAALFVATFVLGVAAGALAHALAVLGG